MPPDETPARAWQEFALPHLGLAFQGMGFGDQPDPESTAMEYEPARQREVLARLESEYSLKV